MKLCPICATSYPAEHRTCPTHGAVLVETPELPAGTIIRDCYRIERVLGKGGMGTVYLAEHTLMGEPRALKFLSSSLAANPTFVQRFLQEAKAASKLRHPNIAQTLELGQTEDGSFYISMEFVDGPSLRALLEQAPHGLPVDRVLNIVRGMAEGLGAAHAKQIVHRDIKPENILLAWNADGETAKVVDFGIVAIGNSVGRMTQTGNPLLTAEYASPEQWRGTPPPSELDGRTDLYALGCVFFEMLTGQLPFHSETYEGWFEQHVHAAPPAPSTLRPELANYPGLDALVLRLLAKERENRPATVWEFLNELNRVSVPLPPPPMPMPNLVPGAVLPPPPSNFVPGYTSGSVSGPASFQRQQTVYETPGLPFVPLPVPGTSATTGPPPTVPLDASYFTGGSRPVPGNTSGQYANVPPIPFPKPGPVPGQPSSSSSRNRGILFGFLGVLVVVAVIAVAAMKFFTRNDKAKDDSQAQQVQETHVQPQVPVSPDGNLKPHPAVSPRPTDTIPLQPVNPNRPVNPNAESVDATAKRAIALYTSKEYGAALPLFTQACNEGHADSCDYLGWMYQHRLGVEQDYAQALALYDTGCRGGSMAGCSNLGVMYQDHLGVTQDYARAVALYTKSCNGNFATGCDNLGVMYQDNLGVARDYRRAASLFTKACDGGSATGCKDLGWMYQYKLGVEQNYPMAAALYEKACNGNVLEGCNNLGFLYQHKLGVEQDYARALALYTKACDAGEATACNNLGVMYQDKQGVEQDFAKAAMLYEKACRGGNSNGCSDLGDLYRTGSGVPKDLDRAKELLTKGCSMGNQWGCDRLKKLQ